MTILIIFLIGASIGTSLIILALIFVQARAQARHEALYGRDEFSDYYDG